MIAEGTPWWVAVLGCVLIAVTGIVCVGGLFVCGVVLLRPAQPEDDGEGMKTERRWTP